MVQTKTPQELADEFGPRVMRIGRLLSMITPWHAPLYVDRAWCLFELFTSIRHSQSVFVEVILPPSQRHDFEAAMAAGNYAMLDKVLEKIRAENATASEAADLEAIQGYVLGLPGGYEALNETVRGHLRCWFEGHGALLTSSRARLLRKAEAKARDVETALSRNASSHTTNASAIGNVVASHGVNTRPHGNVVQNPVFMSEYEDMGVQSEYEDMRVQRTPFEALESFNADVYEDDDEEGATQSLLASTFQCRKL